MTEIPNCPRCGKPGLPIIYSTPEKEICEWCDKGWAAFGGDIVLGKMYGYRCFTCENDFGNPMPNKDFEVWIGFKRAEELFQHGKKIEAIQMLRKNPDLTIKECLKLLEKVEND